MSTGIAHLNKPTRPAGIASNCVLAEHEALQSRGMRTSKRVCHMASRAQDGATDIASLARTAEAVSNMRDSIQVLGVLRERE